MEKKKIDWDDVIRYAEENNLMQVPWDKVLKKYLSYKKNKNNQELIEKE